MLLCEKVILSLARLRKPAKTHLQKHFAGIVGGKVIFDIRFTIRMILIEMTDINVIYYQFMRIFHLSAVRIYIIKIIPRTLYFYPNIYPNVCINSLSNVTLKRILDCT